MRAPEVQCECGERLSSEGVNRMMLARLASSGMNETARRFVALMYRGGLHMHSCGRLAVPRR